MGTPADNPQGYRLSQVTARLGNMKPGALLLAHGMADDNVIFENSTPLIPASAGMSGWGLDPSY
jgi:dipeptidyl-peptidase-4